MIPAHLLLTRTLYQLLNVYPISRYVYETLDSDLSVEGGSADPIKNILLAATLKWAKEQDIPKGNIEKALAKVRHLLIHVIHFTTTTIGNARKV